MAGRLDDEISLQAFFLPGRPAPHNVPKLLLRAHLVVERLADEVVNDQGRGTHQGLVLRNVIFAPESRVVDLKLPRAQDGLPWFLDKQLLFMGFTATDGTCAEFSLDHASRCNGIGRGQVAMDQRLDLALPEQFLAKMVLYVFQRNLTNYRKLFLRSEENLLLQLVFAKAGNPPGIALGEILKATNGAILQ